MKEWSKRLDKINLTQVDSLNKGKGKKLSLTHYRRSGRTQDREEDIFDKEPNEYTDQQEAEDIEKMKEMVWTVVIIVYPPATTKSVEELIAKMDGGDQDNLHFIEPKFNKHDVVIIQSINWPDIQRVAAMLKKILGGKVECILSLENEVVNKTY
eukprot:TRINITY_DN10837_c0_g1_i1.p1 TRINITY_DN10837_c0_g1~~TRINITY_DN10837_c0_g1_i1.p1  ORF type:complete len:154 (+),score=22.86 TRINITY_DN10837_c0_g1_i1:157-618(+)